LDSTPLDSPPSYVYRAKVTNNYDGDTLTVTIDQGLRSFLVGEKVRLYKYDTPELRGPTRSMGLIVRDLVREMIEQCDGEVLIRTHKDKTCKYGRWLAEVFLFPANAAPIALGPWLHEHGYAKILPY